MPSTLSLRLALLNAFPLVGNQLETGHRLPKQQVFPQNRSHVLIRYGSRSDDIDQNVDVEREDGVD